jgi:triosephosphate isomerase
MTPQTRLVAGNWKMNGLKAALAELPAIVAGAARQAATELVVCPPATLALGAAEALAGSRVALGAQDCHWEAAGAFTGDVSAAMWADLRARYAIVGHSERRAGHGETDALVRRKAEAAQAAGLIPIVCVGETLEERDAGRTLEVVRRQVERSLPADGPPAACVIAYEPVWAIGSGRTPTPAEIAEAHAAIRAAAAGTLGEAGRAARVLYGGSVKPENSFELMSITGVDGALVGGASLSARSFLAIAAACEATAERP